MSLPFTIDQFLSVFASYNQSVFPMQIVLNALAVTALALLFVNRKCVGKAISTIIGVLWLWTGFVYHILFFTEINTAAYVFGGLFIFQSVLFFFYGSIKGKLTFKVRKDLFGVTGYIFILYALILYPVIGNFLGHVYPASPTFGAPCPTTIFTFGLLLLTTSRVPKFMLVIPLLWSLIGLSAAINLNVTEDLGLVISGIIGTVLIIVKDKKSAFAEELQVG